ncbi:hypothetical protein Nmel_006661 [Mimus melanotis]
MGAGGCSAGAAERRAVRAGPVPPQAGAPVSPAGEQLARAPKRTCLRVGKGGEMCVRRGAASGQRPAGARRPRRARPPPRLWLREVKRERGGGRTANLGRTWGEPRPLPPFVPGTGRGANPRGRAGVCMRGSGKAAGGVGART